MGVLADWQIRRDIKITPFSEQESRPGIISFGLSSYGYDFRLGFKFRVLTNYPPGVIDPKNFDPGMLTEVDLTPTDHQWDSGGVCWVCKTWVNDNPPPNCFDPPNYLDIPPHSFVLAESLEEVWFPRDVLVLVVGKSTYARCGLIVNVTPGEPEWTGKWTIELTNPTPRYLRVYAGEGIMQCVFSRNDGRYEHSLALITDTLDEGLVYRAGDQYRKEGERERCIQNGIESLRRLTLREPGENGNLEGSCEKSYADKRGKYQNQAGLTTPVVEGTAYDEKTPAPVAEDKTPPPEPVTDPNKPPEWEAGMTDRWQAPNGAWFIWHAYHKRWIQATEPTK